MSNCMIGFTINTLMIVSNFAKLKIKFLINQPLQRRYLLQKIEIQRIGSFSLFSNNSLSIQHCGSTVTSLEKVSQLSTLFVMEDKTSS